MTSISSAQRAFHINNRKKIRELLKEDKKFEGLIVITGNSFMQASADRTFPFVQDSNFFYLTGIQDPEVIFVSDRDTEYLIIPERSVVQVAFEGAADIQRMTEVSGIETIVTENEGWEQLGKRLQSVKKVATLEPHESYVAHFGMFTNPSRQRLVTRLRDKTKTVKLQDIRQPLSVLRMTKSDYELQLIQQAITETYGIFKLIEELRTEAVYEHDLMAEITRMTIKKQLTNAYEPVIASGVNALTLHYEANNAKLDKKGMLLLDIGLKYKGYPADISRTISFAPTKRQQMVFNAVLNVQTYALSFLKPGVTMREYETQVFNFMGEQLQELGLIKDVTKETVREFYPHATSHFLGLDVHDTANYEKPLAPGMVLTVEPGIYIKDEVIGIRLEDDIVITDTGNTVLTNELPKNLSSLTIHP